MAAPASKREPRPSQRGNFVSEWYGHRVFPKVIAGSEALAVQKAGHCPFLTAVTLENTPCIKPPSASGVCAVSSASNGPRQDWLVCPYRALDLSLLEDVSRRLFGVERSRPVLVTPVPTLAKREGHTALMRFAESGNLAVVYLNSKLGGEISLPPTERSPEMAFDITLVELVARGGQLQVRRWAILEVQTMDFHGSYRYAVNNLKDGLRLHDQKFHEVLQDNQGRWLSDRVEGPNIANVFKRTFHQMMLKFQVGAHESSAGCVLAIPQSVWDSWQRLLGRPELRPRPDGTYELAKPGVELSVGHVPAWIYVFDLRADAPVSPSPIEIRRIIATNAESVSYYALQVAPEAAVASEVASGKLFQNIKRRITKWNPNVRPA